MTDEQAPVTAAESTPESRDKAIIKTSVVGIVANVLLAAFKAAVGLLSNSIAIVLDAVNNISDAASSVITIIGTKLASKRPDRKHPFGYGRVEYLTTIIISVIVLWAGITALKESVDRIIHPELPDYSAITLIIVAVAVVAKIVLGLYVKRAGKKYNSGSLVASGTDALTDSILSAATLVAALVFIFTGLSLEAWLGAIIAVVIIKAGIDMLREVLSKIIGERVEGEVSTAVKETVLSVPGVRGAYDLVLDDYGPDRLMGSIHVEVDESLTAREIDQMTRTIQQAVMEKDGVILHTVGVYSANSENESEMYEFVRGLVEADDNILGMHGFYVDEGAKYASFDLVVSFDAPNRRAVIDQARSAFLERYPDYNVRIALDGDVSD